MGWDTKKNHLAATSGLGIARFPNLEPQKGNPEDLDVFLINLQIALESSLDRVGRPDFTGMMVPFWSFSRYELILCGFVSDIDQNHDNLDFQRSKPHVAQSSF